MGRGHGSQVDNLRYGRPKICATGGWRVAGSALYRGGAAGLQIGDFKFQSGETSLHGKGWRWRRGWHPAGMQKPISRFSGGVGVGRLNHRLIALNPPGSPRPWRQVGGWGGGMGFRFAGHRWARRRKHKAGQLRDGGECGHVWQGHGSQVDNLRYGRLKICASVLGRCGELSG